MDPEAEIEIHRRASVWFRERGLFVEAAEHAGEGRDYAFVARLLAENHPSMLQTGLSATLLRGLRSLPQAELLRFPILPVAGAVAVGLTGGSALERRRFLALADRAKAEHPGSVLAYHDAAAEMAHAFWIDDDVGEAVRHGRRAAALAESGGADVYVAALAALAGALYMAGEIDEAAEAAQRPSATSTAGARIWSAWRPGRSSRSSPSSAVTWPRPAATPTRPGSWPGRSACATAGRAGARPPRRRPFWRRRASCPRRSGRPSTPSARARTRRRTSRRPGR